MGVKKMLLSNKSCMTIVSIWRRLTLQSLGETGQAAKKKGKTRDGAGYLMPPALFWAAAAR